MLRNGIIMAALCLVPAMAYGQAAHGPWELELGGSGANGPNFNGFTAAADASIGYYFSDTLEVGLRQSLAYSDVAGVGWDASTRVALDLHIPVTDAFVPYVGGNFGYVYGKGVRDNFEAAPEAGIKYYVNATTFIFVSAEYQFFFNQNSRAGTAFSNGQFIYGLGVGFRF